MSGGSSAVERDILRRKALENIRRECGDLMAAELGRVKPNRNLVQLVDLLQRTVIIIADD